jgi:hypothetical protein
MRDIARIGKIHGHTAACKILLSLLASWGTCAAATPQVWLSPAFSHGERDGSVDNFDLFKDSSPWPEARQRVNVFKIATHTLNRSPDDDIRNMLHFLEAHHIALALEYGMLTPNDACGKGIEGFSPENMPAHVSNRVKSLGGRISYVAMDEPLNFGHYFDRKSNACHWSIDDIARNAAANVKQFREAFPEVEIGDIEPVNNWHNNDWAEDVRRWIEAYRRETGRPLDFFHDDMIWHEPVAGRTRLLTAVLDSYGIRFGVIFNSRAEIGSDQDWLSSVKRNIDEYRGSSLKAPDQIIIQSWRPYPTHVLPESSELSLTHLVNYYFNGR